VLVINRDGSRRTMITRKDLQTALGAIELRTIRNDFKAAIRGVNLGQPLAQAAPRSRIRRDLRLLVTEVANVSVFHANRTGKK
jgi:Flp pilus assembly CpaE family ATPase